MSNLIASSFGNLGIAITHGQIADVEKAAIHFTLRREHPLTFGGPYLGVHPVAWTTADTNTLFDIFHLHRQDVEKAIKATPSIDRNFIVQSDPYNLLCMWLVHLAPIYIKDPKIVREFSLNILRLFHYKIFCSVVNHSFKHGTNEGIMIASVASLSKKSDIVRLGSWRKLIDTHCQKILDPQDRFHQTLVDGYPDDLFLRVVTESQTAIRAKIVTFANAYYEAHMTGDSVRSASSISENKDGERIIAQTASVIDSATQSMISEILNPNTLVHDISVGDVVGMFSSTISHRMLKTALLKINETAVLQTSARSFDKVEVTKNGTLYIGVRVLVIEIIRSMIRLCRERRVNMGNKAQAFDAMRKAYSSSRNLDPDIIAIKTSVGLLVDSFSITTNDASRSALRLAVIYYLLYRTISKM